MYKLMIKKYKKLSSKVANKFVYELKNAFENFNKKTIKILKYGLIFCFLITILSVIILVTYLFFVHSQIIYNIGMIFFIIRNDIFIYCIRYLNARHHNTVFLEIISPRINLPSKVQISNFKNVLE